MSNPTPQTINFQQGDAEWERLRALCLSDLYWFNAYILGYADRVPMRESVHRLLCRFVEKKTGHAILDSAHYRKIEMPRETGKTTLITQGYALQRICTNRDISILLVNEKEQQAKDFLAAIKFQLENNELLRALFPELIPADLNDTTWSASRLVVQRNTGRKDPTLFVIGVGGTVTGMHPDLIICDDIISREAMENARAGAWQIMHQVNRWIHQLDPLLNSNADPFPEIVFIGTRWWHRDCYEHIEEAYGYGEEPQRILLRLQLPGDAQQLQVYRVGDLAVFRRAAIEDGRSIFPEKWDLEKLAKIRVRDEALFACNFLNNPSDEVTATFKETWLQYYDMLDERTYRLTDATGAKQTHGLVDLDRLIFVDPGGFGQRGAEDRARAAVVATGSTPSGQHLLLGISSERDTFLACARTVVDWCGRYTPRKLVIEQAGQQAAFLELVRRMLGDAKLQVTVDAAKPGIKHKEHRILALEPYFQRGSMFLGRGPQFHEFREQYRQFPRSARLDILDALAYLPQYIKKVNTHSPERRIQRELAAYYARRGLPAPEGPTPELAKLAGD